MASIFSLEDTDILDAMMHHTHTTQLTEYKAYFTFGLSAGMQLKKEAGDKIGASIQK